jgi:hypothetical protein
MRSHGVPDFPDPNSNGQIQLAAGPGSDLLPGPARFKSAQQACKSLTPVRSPAQQRQQLAAALRFARCMRAHGMPSFPDPTPQTGLQTRSGGGHSGGGGNTLGNGVDPNSPQFQAANRSCRSLTPGGGGVVVSEGPGS